MSEGGENRKCRGGVNDGTPRAARLAGCTLLFWPCVKRTAAMILFVFAVNALVASPGCRRGSRSKLGAGPADSVAPISPRQLTARDEGASPPPPPLRGIVDPWRWPRAAGASDRQRALEDIGPYETSDPDRPNSPLVNSNADYWTNLVGIAWNRDIDIDFDDEPVDLDADGVSDTHITRHVHAKGGILGNPDLFGLVRTPNDPRGRIGRISVSTGVLGLREALMPDGRPSGQVGMTCFLCHGGRDPADGRVVLGLPGTEFDYGLLLATAAVLDDGNAVAVAARRAHGFPPARTVRSRLLLAGPGRQDLTGEFGLDVTIPGIHSARYPGTRRVRQGITGIVNPISVPGVLAAPGVDLQNWSGSEVASARWLGRVIELGAGSGAEILRLLELPAADLSDLRASAATRRALLLDLRNLGTLGLQQDSFPGLLWADAVYGYANLRPQNLTAIPAMYSAAAVRRVLSGESVPPPRHLDEAHAKSAARGRDIFANRIVGVIANRQILKEPPPLYAAAKPGGSAHTPIVAPIDEALPPTFPVRCADCHNATPGGAPIATALAAPPFGRCSHCHRAHTAVDTGGRAAGDGTFAAALKDRHPLAWFKWPTSAAGEIETCSGCHLRHRPFAPVAYSSSMLLPFDADGDGVAQDDESDDQRAGGIGTEALLAFDVPRNQRSSAGTSTGTGSHRNRTAGFSVDLPSLSQLHSLGPIGVTHIGVSWVRVAPLLGVRATAPYLHNGSVPTLRALLEPARRRPMSFSLGKAGFVFDTRLPGNRNIGHEYGTTLTAREKDDLVAFLETL